MYPKFVTSYLKREEKNNVCKPTFHFDSSILCTYMGLNLTTIGSNRLLPMVLNGISSAANAISTWKDNSTCVIWHTYTVDIVLNWEVDLPLFCRGFYRYYLIISLTSPPRSGHRGTMLLKQRSVKIAFLRTLLPLPLMWCQNIGTITAPLRPAYQTTPFWITWNIVLWQETYGYPCSYAYFIDINEISLIGW